MNNYYAVVRSDSYLAHHGVKGMKWGVRHDDRSLSDRWKSSINKRYDKKNAKIEAKRKRSEADNWLRNTGYGKKVNEINNRKYDKKIASNNRKRDNDIKQVDNIVSAKNKISDSIKSFKDTRAREKEARYNRSDYAKAKKMTDKELIARTNRINLEQNYLRALSRDKTLYNDARSSEIAKIGRRTLDALDRQLLDIGVTAIDIGYQSSRNATTNVINRRFPITKKPKKK